MRRRDLKAQGDDGQMRAAVQRARDDVHAACHQGTVVCCPNAQCVADTQTGRTEYIKDSEDGNCIHMVCSACATPFCYVCGRANGSRPGECARRSVQPEPSFCAPRCVRRPILTLQVNRGSLSIAAVVVRASLKEQPYNKPWQEEKGLKFVQNDARRPLFGGCDAHQLYIEKQPGWNRFARGGESAAVGALREFHRQRVGSFVRD